MTALLDQTPTRCRASSPTTLNQGVRLAEWLPTPLDDIDSELYYYNYMRVFGLPELCELVLKQVVSGFYTSHRHPGRRGANHWPECRCSLRQLFHCRHICRTIRNIIDSSPAMRQALFLDPIPSSSGLLNCILPPHLTCLQQNLPFAATRMGWSWKTGERSPRGMISTEINVARALEWESSGLLCESAQLSHPPMHTMILYEAQGRFEETTGLSRKVELSDGITIEKLMEEAKAFAALVPRKPKGKVLIDMWPVTGEEEQLSDSGDDFWSDSDDDFLSS